MKLFMLPKKNFLDTLKKKKLFSLTEDFFPCNKIFFLTSRKKFLGQEKITCGKKNMLCHHIKRNLLATQNIAVSGKKAFLHLHIKNKTPVLGNAVPILGMKLKRG